MSGMKRRTKGIRHPPNAGTGIAFQLPPCNAFVTPFYLISAQIRGPCPPSRRGTSTQIIVTRPQQRFFHIFFNYFFLGSKCSEPMRFFLSRVKSTHKNTICLPCIIFKRTQVLRLRHLTSLDFQPALRPSYIIEQDTLNPTEPCRRPPSNHPPPLSSVLPRPSQRPPHQNPRPHSIWSSARLFF